MHFKPLFLLLSAALLLNACADPVVVPQLTPRDKARFTCEDIKLQIDSAEGYRVASRADDRFKAQYALFGPAIVSVYRINKAEKAAIARKKQLEELWEAKGCATRVPQAPQAPQPQPTGSR